MFSPCAFLWLPFFFIFFSSSPFRTPRRVQRGRVIRSWTWLGQDFIAPLLGLFPACCDTMSNHTFAHGPASDFCVLLKFHLYDFPQIAIATARAARYIRRIWVPQVPHYRTGASNTAARVGEAARPHLDAIKQLSRGLRAVGAAFAKP